jgi:hypothetical protein
MTIPLQQSFHQAGCREHGQNHHNFQQMWLPCRLYQRLYQGSRLHYSELGQNHRCYHCKNVPLLQSCRQTELQEHGHNHHHF